MATEQLIITAVNKTGAALGKLQKDLAGINSATNSLSSGFSRLQTLIVGAAAAFGGFKLAGGFLDTARQLENLGLQLKAITGSATEGAKALDIVKEAAGNSAFQLQEMAQAAPLLLSVADSTEELNNLLSITGDIAVAGGLDFVQAAEQLQRAFSAGIASADLFRERGIKAMLGFQEGVQYTAEETKNLIIQGMQDGSISIAGIAAEMALSFDGSFSMIQDAVFRFQAAVMDAGPFDMLKSAMTIVVDELNANFGDIEGAAVSFGNKIVEVVSNSIIGFGMLMDALQPIFNFVRESVNNMLTFTDGLPTELKLLGVIGFLALGLKGKLIVVTISNVIDDVMKLFGHLYGAIGSAIGSIGNLVEKIPGLGDIGRYMQESGEIAKAEAEKMKTAFGGIGKAIDDSTDLNIKLMESFEEYENMGKYEKAARSFVERLHQITIERNEAAEKAQEETSKKQIETVEEQLSKEDQLLQKKLKTLEEALMSEVEAIENTRKKHLEIVEDNLQKQFISEEQAAQLRIKINEEAEEKLNIIKEKASEEAIKIAQEAADALAKLEEDYFEVKKALYNTDEDNIREAYERRIKIVEDAMAKEIDAEADKAKIIKDLNTKMQKELTELYKKEAEKRRLEEYRAKGLSEEQAKELNEQVKLFEKDKGEFIIQNTGDILQSLGTMNRQAFQAYKAFAIAEAIVSTYKGAAAAIGSGLPPPFNFIAAAAVVAQGLAQVNAIRNTNYSGRAMGGPVGAGQTYMVGEQGPEIFRAPAGGGTIIPNGGGTGAVTINFNVQAIDAQSFNSAITKQKNTIVNIVNEAVNNTGRRAITAY